MKLAMVQDTRLPDPRTLIKSAPLPFPSHTGVKIQARSFNVYNATIPSRDFIRKENYLRRKDQMTSMGFKTPLNLPYRVIGDPLFLDHENIILYGLGQKKEATSHDNQINFSIKNSKEDNLDLNKIKINNKSNQATRSFTYRNLNSSKKLINLRNEILKTQMLMKQVKLGHSLFDTLKKDEELKKQRELNEKNSSSMSMKIVPIEDNFDQDSSDDDYATEYTTRVFDNASPGVMSMFNNRNTFATTTAQSEVHSSTAMRTIRVFSKTNLIEEELGEDSQFMKNQQQVEAINSNAINSTNRTDIIMSRQQTFKQANSIAQRPSTVPSYSNYKSNSEHVSTKRPKTTGSRRHFYNKDTSRPYTPMYSGLLTKDEIQLDKNSFQRQLCVLLWILDSTANCVEPFSTISPLRTCFSINNLGTKKSIEKEPNEHEIERQWKKFEKMNKKIENEKSYMASTRKNKKPSKNVHTTSDMPNLEDQSNENVYEDDNEQRDIHMKRQINDFSPSSALNDSYGEDDFVARQHQNQKRAQNLSANNLTMFNTNQKDLSTESLQDLSENKNESINHNSNYHIITPLTNNNNNNNLDESNNNENLFYLNLTNTINNNNNNNQHNNLINSTNNTNIIGMNNNTSQNLEQANLASEVNTNRDSLFLTQLVDGSHNQGQLPIQKEYSNSINEAQQLNHAAMLAKTNRLGERARSKSSKPTKNPIQNKTMLSKSNNFLNMSNMSNNQITFLSEHELELIKIGDVDEMDRILNKPGIKSDRRNSSSLKASRKPIHALKTEKVIEYEKRLPSVKKTQKLQEIKDQFENLIDEKALEIDKRLDMHLQKRASSCLVKYSSLNLKERGLHTMLKNMNKSYMNYEKTLEEKNSPDPKFYQWYLDILEVVENNYGREDCVLSQLLERLSVYGKLTAKKQNEALFFRVLDTIRTWELISPDVMSAIEFCRERILEIPVTEFEKWFKAKHPTCFPNNNDDLFDSKLKKDD